MNPQRVKVVYLSYVEQDKMNGEFFRIRNLPVKIDLAPIFSQVNFGKVVLSFDPEITKSDTLCHCSPVKAVRFLIPPGSGFSLSKLSNLILI
jgi:hypothetical protein